MREIWKPIPGFEGCYSASNMGRVRSNRRMKLLTPSIDRDGYLKVGPCVDGKTFNLMIHRAVLLAFRGKPKQREEASHVDGSRKNNNLSNLVWETSKKNQSRKKAHGTIVRGEAIGTSKLTPKLVRRIRASKKSGYILAREIGVARSTINRARSKETWSWL